MDSLFAALSTIFYKVSFRHQKIILKITKKVGGTRSDGSIFSVLQSFIFKIEIPELAIKIPPRREISVSNSGVKNGSNQVAQR